jgi:AraC-like DNA-binding protein
MRTLDGNAPMQYQEFPVPSHLRSHVAALWHLRDPAPASASQTIYPDGRCELIVHLGVPPRGWDLKRQWHDQAVTLFAAQHLTPVRLMAAGPLDCVGLRLTPEASSLLGPHTRVRDKILDLAQVDAALSRSLRRVIRSFAAGNAAPLWRLVERRISRQPIDPDVARAVGLIQQSHGLRRIDGVAREVGLGMRSLQSRFRRCVSLTPKEFARVCRLRALLRALDTTDTGVAELAADRGFSDQAHATRELRRVTGLAPARLRSALRADRDGDAAVRLAAAFVRGS